MMRLGCCNRRSSSQVLYGKKFIDKGYVGIKEYSEWPTIPQLYVNNEFIGGYDILMSMHQDGQLSKMLEEKQLLAPASEDLPKS
jgi:glutaredoxin-related protein